MTKLPGLTLDLHENKQGQTFALILQQDSAFCVCVPSSRPPSLLHGNSFIFTRWPCERKFPQATRLCGLCSGQPGCGWWTGMWWQGTTRLLRESRAEQACGCPHTSTGTPTGVGVPQYASSSGETHI